MQVTKVNIVSITTSDVEIQDMFTGTRYLVENKDFTSGQNVTINSQTYTITNNTLGGSSAGFKITRAGADAVDKRAVFPYLELVAGEDFPRVTFINTTNAINDATGDNITGLGATGYVTGRTYELPTGSVQFRLANTTSTWVEYGVTPTDGTVSWTNISGTNSTTGVTSVQVGEGWYTFGSVTVAADATTFPSFKIANVTLDLGFDAYAADSVPVNPVVMFVEDKDKSDSDARNVVVLNTTDSSTYSQLHNVLFSGSSQYDSETWEDTDYTGYLTNYGTYVVQDSSDSNQAMARLSYGTAQMYGGVYLAEADASISAGSTGGASQLGDVLVKDTEVSSVGTKNLIVVGGSCINSAAATLIGSAACGASFTDATGVGSGQFLIKGYDSSSLTSKLALLVAGYDAADTVNAAMYLRNKAVDTSKEYLGTSATSATLVTTSA
jgi:hypothetical protein